MKENKRVGTYNFFFLLLSEFHRTMFLISFCISAVTQREKKKEKDR